MSNQYDCAIADFDVAYKAIRDTEWLTEPDNPTNLSKGIVHRGNTVWFHPDHFGSGPTWQQARLSDKTLRYVHLSDFKKVVAKVMQIDSNHAPG